MGLWTAIVVIALVIAVTTVLQARYRAQHGITVDMMGNEKRQPPVNPAENEQLRSEVAELRQRVQVLERILTDERQRLGLADEIERLRDES